MSVTSIVPYDPTTFLYDEPRTGHMRAAPVDPTPHVQKNKHQFQFSKLPPGYIRIIVLRPATKFDDPLELDLYAAPFEATPGMKALKYQALSYEWGDSPQINPVTLRDFTRQLSEIPPRLRLQFLTFKAIGRRVYIGSNLNAALRHLRHKDQSLKFWVDAICINQLDNNEKAHQIEKMAEIYNSAYNVCVWLGSGHTLADDGIDFVKELKAELMTRSTKSKTEDDIPISKWRSLIDLMRSRWFSRRWIIQEIAVARNATVHWGSNFVHWEDLATAFSILDNEIEDSRRRRALLENDIDESRRRKHQEERLDLGTLNFISGCGARQLSKLKLRLVEKNQLGQIINRHESLENLVAELVPFASGDPRDLIYALLSVAQGNPAELRPDYQKSVLQVYTDFVKHCVTQSNSLNILCRHWAPVQVAVRVQRKSQDPQKTSTLHIETVLPSWMSTLDKSAFGPPDLVFGGRRYPDALVGPPYNYAYNASRKSIPTFEFRKRSQELTADEAGLRESYDGTLSVRGFILGTVRQLSPRLMTGKLPQEFLEMGDWAWAPQAVRHNVNDVPDRLWRTMMANCDEYGRSLDARHRLACLHALQKADISGDVDIKAIIDDSETQENISRTLKRVQDVICNRKAFLGGKSKQYFGLCPKQTEVDDLVCILLGCSVPVILRGTTDKPNLGQRPIDSTRAPTTMVIPPPLAEGSAGANTMAETLPALNLTADTMTDITLSIESRLCTKDVRGHLKTPPPTRRVRKRKARFTPARANPKRRNTVIKLESSPPTLLDEEVDELTYHEMPTPSGSSIIDTDAYTDNDDLNPVYYQLVDECFVYGYMDGAAMDLEGREEQDFILV